MKLNLRLTEKEFVKANFIFLFFQSRLRYFVIFYFVVFGFNIISSTAKTGTIAFTTLIPAILFVLIFYFFVKRAFSKSYHQNKRNDETATIEFEEKKLTITGESYQTLMTWDKMYKVSNPKDFIFIWYTKFSAAPIPRKVITEEAINELKEILKRNNVKNNL